MRPLTEDETKAVFEKLANYVGKNLVHLIDRDEDDQYCFRLHKDRYVEEGGEWRDCGSSWSYAAATDGSVRSPATLLSSRNRRWS
jgi:hypothetical protein